MLANEGAGRVQRGSALSLYTVSTFSILFPFILNTARANLFQGVRKAQANSKLWPESVIKN